MVYRKDEIKETIHMSNIKRIDGFDYPMGYETIVDLNLVDFEYWYFIPDSQLDNRYNGMKERYPNRKYIPLIMMILLVLKKEKEKKFLLFMISQMKGMNSEKHMTIFGNG